MSDVPVQLMVAAFNDEEGAKQALKELKRLKRVRLIGIQNAAVLRKDEKGKLHIKETADMGGGKGAALGGVAGAAIGLFAGPALLVPAAVGALVGGLTAKLRDSGFSNARLEQLGDGLKPGSSAIIAVVEHKWVGQLEKELEAYAADVFTAELSADIATQLEAGHDVAYSAIASREGYAVGRMAGNDDELEGSAMVIDASGMYGSQFVATKEGFIVRGFEANDEGLFEEGMVADASGAVYGATFTDSEGTVGVIAAAEAASEDAEGVETEAEAASDAEASDGEEESTTAA